MVGIRNLVVFHFGHVVLLIHLLYHPLNRASFINKQLSWDIPIYIISLHQMKDISPAPGQNWKWIDVFRISYKEFSLCLTTYGLCSSSCSREGSCIFWKCLLMLLLLNALKNVIRLTGQIRSLKTIFSSLEDTVHESKCKHRYVYAIPGW